MRIAVTVVPKAGRNAVERIRGNEYRVRATAIPAEGKANVALVRILAKHFRVAPSLVEIVSGKTARKKMVEITK